MASPSPESVLQELTELWVSLGGDSHGGPEAGVLRACSMTLLVLTETGEDSAALGETIAALMTEHPARTIVVRLSGATPAAFDARVQSQCWMPFGSRRQICCEQIEVTASDSSLPDIPAFLVPLLAPDLPVIVWCRSPRAAADPAFDEIAHISTKMVLDSAGFPDGLAAFQLLSRRVAAGQAVGDLAWTRLTRWREMLCRAFDRGGVLERLPRVTNVQVSYGPAEETSARYLAAWLSTALPPAKIRPGTALAVLLSGDGIAIELSARDGRLGITVDGVFDCAPLPAPGDYSLVREELGILRRDPVFEKALASAARLAYPTDK
jgi:glucose-6-phosphate dehydrogenase assembly protein OpcA